MDIIDDLNLIGFDDDFPNSLDALFDLDDILSEFSTPGLFEKKTEAQPAGDDEPSSRPSAAAVAEEEPAPVADIPMPTIAKPEDVFVPDDPTITFDAITDAALTTPVEEEPPVSVPAPEVPEAAEPTPEAEELDWTFDLHHTEADVPPLFAEDAPLYGFDPDEEDVPIYVPAKGKPDYDNAELPETIPFTAVSPAQDTAPARAAEAPGVLGKIAGMFAGLFAKKPASPKAMPKEDDNWVNPFREAAEPVEDMQEMEEALPEIADELPASEESLPLWENAVPETTLFDLFEAAEEAEIDLSPEAEETLPEEEPAAPVFEAEEAPVEPFDAVLSQEELPAEECPTEQAPPAEADDFVLPGLDDLLFEFGDAEELPLYHTEEPDQAAEVPAAQAPKAPGLMARIAGTVAGLFAGLRSKQAPAESITEVPAEDPADVPPMDEDIPLLMAEEEPAPAPAETIRFETAEEPAELPPVEIEAELPEETMLFEAVEEPAELPPVEIEAELPEETMLFEAVEEPAELPPVEIEAELPEETMLFEAVEEPAELPPVEIEAEPTAETVVFDAIDDAEVLPMEEDMDLSISVEDLLDEFGSGEDTLLTIDDPFAGAPDLDTFVHGSEPYGSAAPAAQTPKAPGLLTQMAGTAAGLFAELQAKFARKRHNEPAPAPAAVPAADALPIVSLDDEDVPLFTARETPAETVVFDAVEDTFADEAAVAEILPEIADTQAEEAPAETMIFDAVETAADGYGMSEEEKSEENCPFLVDGLLFDIGLDELTEDDVRRYDFTEEALPDPITSQDTMPFTAVPEARLPDAAPAAAETAAPGLLTQVTTTIAGVLAGLLNKKKPAPAAPVPAPAAAPVDDPFADLAGLFAAGDAGDMDPELLSEVESTVEAIRAKEEAERLAAEEEARLIAEEEAPLTPEQETRLFAWLDSIAPEEAPAEEAETPVSDPVPVLEPEMAPQPEYMSMFLSNEEPAQAIPELTIDEEELPAAEEAPEPVDPEALQDTMEMVEVLRKAEESPAEAAARRAKEDEELRYVPEETPAEAIGSAITGRLGAAFAAFTHSGAGTGEEEEDLGEEVPPSKAYRYFNQYINGYRFRLRVSVILSIIVGWISLGLPVFGSLNNPAVAAAACLMIQLTIMLAGADILATGVRSVLRRKPGLHGMVFLSCIASIVDALVIIYTKGAGGYLPFCGVSAISMCFAIYGSLLYCRSQRLTFKSLEQAAEPMTINVDYGIVDEETTTAYRIPGAPEEFIHRSEEEDLSETVYGILGPILTVVIPVLALAAAFASKHMGDFFHIMAAMFAASTSFGAMVAFPLPYFQVQRDLYAAKAAIAGWSGAREIGRVATMIVTDRDLFPDETVSISSVRIVDNVPPELTLSYICSVILKSGSCLVPAFVQLAENNDCEILPVENFQCHEAGGLSGTIGPDEVLVASHSYMKLQGFRIPARKKDSENALFLAVNGHVISYVMVDYKPVKSVRAGLASAIQGNVEMVFAARDFNITPLLISKKFKSPTDTLRFPSYSQRFEITDHSGSDTATCAAVVSRKSFYSYAMVVEKARNLYNSVSWAVILSAISSLLGVILMFVMAVTGGGAAVTVGKLLIFMLLFVVPTLALCVSITK